MDYRGSGVENVIGVNIVTLNACEQRNSRRARVNWPISVWHPKASRFFNGRSVDISRCGALIVLSMKVPVSEGQDLEVNFPRNETLAKEKGRFARTKTAKVVRVDRSKAVESTKVKVGLEFREITT